MKEWLLGFDCRTLALNTKEAWRYFGAEDLLRSDVTYILNVDPIQWRSLFFFFEIQEANGIRYGSSTKTRIPIESRTYDGYWDDLDAMRKYLQEHPHADQKPYWLIAISVLHIPEYSQELYRPVRTQEPDPAWTLIGYDVESAVLHDRGLIDPLPEPYQSERRQLFGSKLNEYHLFAEADDAHSYALWHMNAYPAVGSQLVFGLYVIEIVD